MTDESGRQIDESLSDCPSLTDLGLEVLVLGLRRCDDPIVGLDRFLEGGGCRLRLAAAAVKASSADATLVRATSTGDCGVLRSPMFTSPRR